MNALRSLFLVCVCVLMGEVRNTAFFEVVDVEADVPLPLRRHPAEVEKLFPHRQGDVGRRCCKALTVRN